MRTRLALGLVVVALSLGSSVASARVAARRRRPRSRSPSRPTARAESWRRSPRRCRSSSTVTNFKLSAADFGKAPVKGEGHLFFSIDHGKFDHPAYSGANGKLAAKIGVEGKYSPSVTPKITYKNLPSGKHTVVVYLVSNDNKKLGPSDKVDFTVQ